MTGFLTAPAAYPYRTGSLFLGLDPATNAPVGVSTERHAITIAGARSGKGAALLIPNALRWSDNLLVIDPKGEIANAAWQAREALGQQVAVLDPFGAAKAVPDRLRATFNPLAEIDLASPVAGDEIRVIADGLVKRHKAEDGDWYDGAVRILAGVLAFVMESAPPEHRTFAAMRSVLLQPNEVKDDEGNLVGGLYHDAQMMQGCTAFGGLAKGAGVSIMTALTSDKGQEKTHLGMAREATVWMDQPLIASTLAASSFDLRDLKAGKLSVFLVLPPKYMGDYSAFLRLFVRAAINAMMDDDADNPRRCLFLLDEFYSLGKLDVVEQAAGLMGGYGLHLWPFMQDLGQLRQLYGDRMAETFFSNADAAVFFGNSDRATLQYVSGWAGNLTPSEVVAAPPPQNYTAVRDPEKTGFFGGGYYGQKFFEGEKEYRSRISTEDENNRRMQASIDANHRANYEHNMRQSGKPRLTPEQVAALVGKKDGDKVARSALVFTKGSDVLNVRLQPYFEAGAAPVSARAQARADTSETPIYARKNYLDSLWIIAAPVVILAYTFLPNSAVPFALGAIMAGTGIITTRPATITHFVEVFGMAWAAIVGMSTLGNIGGKFLGFPDSHALPVTIGLVAATYVLHLWAINARSRYRIL
jgi:hypothetical protein